MVDYEAEIKKHNIEIERLKKEKAMMENRNFNTKDLAVFLHDKLCRLDHTEQCGWYYEISEGVHDWNRCAHERWLEYAEKIDRFMKKYNVKDVQTMLKILNDLKNP